MLKARINGKTLSIETRWEELSFRKNLALARAHLADPEIKTSRVLAILLDLPVETIQNSRIEGIESVIAAQSFLTAPPVLDENPKRLGLWELPKMEDCTVEQYEMLRAEINKAALKDEGPDQNEHLPIYAAIFLHPIKDNCPFDYQKALKFAEVLQEYPCTEVMSVGAFFLMKDLNLRPNLPQNFRLPPTLRKKQRRGLKQLIRHLASTLRSTLWRGMLANRIKKYYAGRSPSSTPS